MVRIEFERKVGPKGQVVIPKEIRKLLGIRPETSVYVSIEDEKVVIKPKTGSLKQFLSIIPVEKRKKMKMKDFDKWYEEEVEEKWRRINRALPRR
ncbi:MAG: AbrB/MazE/SpoVT family DNA-binding domain-containing protein [Candidatus Aenigmarchaeota archaeon]|nr:AbrB/MazE/SpoVT family DNA-binding domain-containing protein [Candidatus Aenigmarchaeota archaeon]